MSVRIQNVKCQNTLFFVATAARNIYITTCLEKSRSYEADSCSHICAIRRYYETRCFIAFRFKILIFRTIQITSLW